MSDHRYHCETLNRKPKSRLNRDRKIEREKDYSVMTAEDLDWFAVPAIKLA